jgi:hypothetical protein
MLIPEAIELPHQQFRDLRPPLRMECHGWEEFELDNQGRNMEINGALANTLDHFSVLAAHFRPGIAFDEHRREGEVDLGKDCAGADPDTALEDYGMGRTAEDEIFGIGDGKCAKW